MSPKAVDDSDARRAAAAAQSAAATANEAASVATAAQRRLAELCSEAVRAKISRKAVTSAEKLSAVKLLGYLGGGEWAAKARVNEGDGGAPWNNSTVARRIGVSKSAVSAWRKRARDYECDSKRGASAKRVRLGAYPLVDDALEEYFASARSLAGGSNVFFTDVALQQKAIELQKLILEKLFSHIARAQASERPGESAVLSKAASHLTGFKASSGWVRNWKSRAGIASRKGCGASGQVSPDTLTAHRANLRKKIAGVALDSLVNSDEVGVLYRSGPSRSNQTAQGHAGHVIRKDRLSVLLSVSADGSKLPLSIIGPSKRPRSFPRHCNLPVEKNVFYFHQANSWMTRGIWASITRGMGKSAVLQGRSVVNIVDNCSAHGINDDVTGYKPLLLPPNLTSELQPVDLGVGRSFKAAYRRLLVAKIISFVDGMVGEQAAGRAPPKFKISEIVTSWDGVCMIAKAWDMVPKSVILRSWLKSGILCPHQDDQARRILEASVDVVEKAKRAPCGSCLPSEKEAASAAAAAARRRGELYLSSQAADGRDDAPADLSPGADAAACADAGALEGLGGDLEALRSKAGALDRSCIDDQLRGFIDSDFSVEACAGADGSDDGSAPQMESAAADAVTDEAISRILGPLSTADEQAVNDGELSVGEASAQEGGEDIERVALPEYLGTISKLARQIRGFLTASGEGMDDSKLFLRLLSLEEERVRKIIHTRLKQSKIDRYFSPFTG